MPENKRSSAWPKGTKWYPDDYTPIGGRWNPRWKEWIKEHPEYADDERIVSNASAGRDG